MDGHLGEKVAISNLGTGRSLEWMHRVVTLLEAAVGQLHDQEHPVQATLLEAASLLRQQLHPSAAREVADGRGRLPAWQARKVRDYIDSHISGPVLIADLCALIRRSEAHFSRSFKRTFGESPHSFVVRRRVELAAQYMLATDASLSDIALGCGFTDQAHMCRHFRQAAGQPPAAWRRGQRSHHDEHGTPPVEHDPSANDQASEAVGDESGSGYCAALRGVNGVHGRRRPSRNVGQLEAFREKTRPQEAREFRRIVPGHHVEVGFRCM
jgi:AraC-like DNA-binding protein